MSPAPPDPRDGSQRLRRGLRPGLRAFALDRRGGVRPRPARGCRQRGWPASGALRGAARGACGRQQRALIDAHPDLAGRLARAGRLTADSSKEQASAGLDRLTDARARALHRAQRRLPGALRFPVHHGGQGPEQGRDPRGVRAPADERCRRPSSGPRSSRSSASRCCVSRICCRDERARPSVRR